VRVHPLLALMAILPLAAACDDDGEAARFRVEIENVSTQGLIDSPRADGTMPLSVGIWTVYEDDDPTFEVDDDASAGLELLAEEGIPSEQFAPGNVTADLLSEVAADDDVHIVEILESPGGPDGGPDLYAGERVVLEFVAEPGDDLQFVSSLLQSNDLFVAFDGGGLDLFDIFGDPREGNVTDEVAIFDAGTEVDEILGQGDAQPLSPNSTLGAGTPENAEVTQGEFAQDVPAVEEFIRVIITAL